MCLPERCPALDERVKAVEHFSATGELDENANIQFGEGGAGTFSDGKLTTRIGDELCGFVTEVFLQHGAPAEIAWKQKPHVGTDLLRGVITSIRKEIESLGGKAAYLEYLHQAYLTDRAYDKFQENKLWYELLYDHMLEDSSVYFTDEMLRQYFAENYATVECICISTLDDEGQPLSAQEIRDKGQLAASVAAQAKAEGADFEALWLEYNEDPSVPMDVPMGRQEAASTYYLKTLFDLAENQVSSPIEEEDGFYILKRCPLSVSYYDENQAEIYQEALDWRFSQLLDEWKTDYSVTQQPVIQKITLNNLTDYIK